MAHVVLEHVILLPLLVLQVLLFPFATSVITSAWEGARQQVALEESASRLGSTIQQLYFSLSEEKIRSGTVIQALDLPPTIEGHAYNAKGTIIPQNDKKINDSRILSLTLELEGTDNSASAKVTLGPNARWDDGVFRSNSANPYIRVQKIVSNYTYPYVLRFSFGGG